MPLSCGPMRGLAHPLLVLCFAMIFSLTPSALRGQGNLHLFPDRSLIPDLLAGPREPVTSATLLGVTRNPDAFGNGVEVEVSIGTTLPVLLLAGEPGRNPIVAGIEGVAFARFGLQVVERELIASDWVFAVPVIRRSDRGWVRFRYYHTSSHMGDEYARRFGDQGINFSRDAAELMVFRHLRDHVGAYGGARYAYNVHPEESRRWVLRTGAQLEGDDGNGPLLPYAGIDVEWDQDAAAGLRVDCRAGTWLPMVAHRRAIRLSFDFLVGPSPLGQFNGRRTTQIGISLQGSL